MESIFIPFVLFLVIAMLYSSVGHAGASGYLAVMAILGFAPDSIKPTSLILNVVVAAIASYKFIRSGCFDRKIFFAFIFSSLPLAFVGGYIGISARYFKLLAGIFLIISALLLVGKEYLHNKNSVVRPMPPAWSLGLGSVIGFISGLIGVGGGIFLSPILILGNWASARNTAGISALFILCNSVAGLLGHVSALNKVDTDIAYWIPAVIMGGLLGSYFGSRRFTNKVIIVLLFVVLLSAGIKFVMAAA